MSEESTVWPRPCRTRARHPARPRTTGGSRPPSTSSPPFELNWLTGNDSADELHPWPRRLLLLRLERCAADHPSSWAAVHGTVIQIDQDGPEHQRFAAALRDEQITVLCTWSRRSGTAVGRTSGRTCTARTGSAG